MSAPLVAAIRQGLAEHANPDKAEGMRAYMKSAMPYRGVQAPMVRSLVRDALKAHPIADKQTWTGVVLELWDHAEYREERYSALQVAGSRACQPFRTFDTLSMFEHMVTSGAWWDFVDDIASHRLRELLERFPDEMTPQMRAWSRDPDMWKRRSAILCQLGRKEQTDLPLLFDCIEPNLSDREFFIRKGIGWALRDLAYSNLGAVEEYVARNRERMSALSAREALKNAEKLRGGGRRPSTPVA